jgi:hypothetical protein
MIDRRVRERPHSAADAPKCRSGGAGQAILDLVLAVQSEPQWSHRTGDLAAALGSHTNIGARARTAVHVRAPMLVCQALAG